jgi:hypothetical protein
MPGRKALAPRLSMLASIDTRAEVVGNTPVRAPRYQSQRIHKAKSARIVDLTARSTLSWFARWFTLRHDYRDS